MMKKQKGALKNFFEEFKKFITRGNVLDMSVGVIVGGAFTGIVNGLSNFILKPLINWLLSLVLPGDGLAAAVTMLAPAYTDVLNESGAVIGQTLDLEASIYIDWGAFISAIINFLLIAFVLFTIVRVINNLNSARDKAEDEVKSKRTEKKQIKAIAKEQKIKYKDAKAIYEAKVAEAAAAKVAEEKAKAEEAAKAEVAAKAAAEEKAMQNTVLLQEILAVLKSK